MLSVMQFSVENALGYLPQVVEMLICLLIGYIVAYVVKRLLFKGLTAIKFDDLCSKVNLQQTLNRIGIKSAASLSSNYVFWAIFISSLYIAFGFITAPEANRVLSRVALVLVDIVAAAGIMLIGIALMEVLITVFKRLFAVWNLEQVFAPVDRAIERAGLKTFDILYITVRAFVVLLFLEFALWVFRADFLMPYVTPVLVFIPRVIMAMLVVIAGVAVAEFAVRIIFGILDAIGVISIIEPLERTMKAKGLIITALRWILRISIFLLFLQLAFSIVDLPTAPVMVLLSYLPEALIAIVVLIIAWWLSSRLGNAFERLALERDLPFVDLFTMAIKFIVIYVGIIIALDELGLEIQALYILLAFMAGAFCVGFAGVFIFGFKDVGADLASSMQLKRNGEIGDTIIFGERIGRIAEITNLSTTIETDEGRMIVPNTRLRDAIIIKDQNKSG